MVFTVRQVAIVNCDGKSVGLLGGLAPFIVSLLYIMVMEMAESKVSSTDRLRPLESSLCEHELEVSRKERLLMNSG